MDGEYVLSSTRSLVRWMWGDAWGLKRYGGHGSELIDDPAQRQRCDVCKNMHAVPLCFSRAYALWWFKHTTIFFFLLIDAKITSLAWQNHLGPRSTFCLFFRAFKPGVMCFVRSWNVSHVITSGRKWRDEILSPCFWLYNCQSFFKCRIFSTGRGDVSALSNQERKPLRNREGLHMTEPVIVNC